jgi:hypothetical protein
LTHDHDNILPNVSKFRYDPSKLANAWQKIPIHSPICLDGKSVTCNRLRHISYPKYPRLIQPLSRACVSFCLCFFISLVRAFGPHSPIFTAIFLISFTNSSARTKVFEVSFWFSTLQTCFRTIPKKCNHWALLIHNHRALLQRTQSLQGVGQLRMQNRYVIAGHRRVH